MTMSIRRCVTWGVFPVIVVLAGCGADAAPEEAEPQSEASGSELTTSKSCTPWARVSGLCWTRECRSHEHACVSERSLRMYDRTELETWGAACNGGWIRVSNSRDVQCWQGTRCDEGVCVP